MIKMPKSRIEQAVGRIFRLKKEERVFNPIIYDVHDTHDVLQGQYRKRIQFYEQCAYKIFVKEPGSTYKEIKGKGKTKGKGKGKGKDSQKKESEGEDEIENKPLFRT